jgi:hypothetical protein
MGPVTELHKKLKRAFNPRTVAVVGDKRALGYLWLNAMKTFQGKVYSVQISKDEIPGIEAMNVPNYFSLLDIPDELDYVVCAVRRDISRASSLTARARGQPPSLCSPPVSPRRSRRRASASSGSWASSPARTACCLSGPTAWASTTRAWACARAPSSRRARPAT